MSSVHPQQLPLFSYSRACTRCGVVKPFDQFTRSKGRYRSFCRACDSARSNAYGAAHAEERKARSVAWRSADPERARAGVRAYHAAHREEVNQLNAEWRAKNGERVAENLRRWLRENPEAIRAYTSRRRARKLAAPGNHTQEDIERMKEAQQGLCAYCGKPYGTFHVEHKQPLCRGGSNGPENLCLSCPTCNQRKGRKTEAEFLRYVLFQSTQPTKE